VINTQSFKMRSSVLSAAALVTRVIADAPPSTDNPAGVVYQAVLPDEPFFADTAIEGNVKGSITAVARENGNGVRFAVKFENLPAEGGPFTYHIHKAAAVDGNCTTTLSHLDPFEAGVEIPCDPENPQTCEIGDLAGKHGKIDSDPYEKHYADMYAATNPESEAYFGDLSFVLHFANSTRITCANFELKKVVKPTPGDEDCTDAPETPVETPITTPTAVYEEPPVVTETQVIEVPCESACEGGDKPEGEKPEGDKPEGDKPEGDKPEGDMPEDEMPEEDMPEEGGDQDDDETIVPPPPQDNDTPPASTPSPEVPVEAGATMQHMSVTLLSLGVAAAMFMTS
jgi:hypothetical protein